MMNSINLTVCADYACVTGEGPLWHPDEKRVYWVDIPPGRLYRYDPATGEHEQCLEVDRPLGGYTIQEDGSLILFMGQGRIAHWRQGSLTTLIDNIADEIDGRFNDITTDPEGRVFCGTMPVGDRNGKLYRLDPDGSLTVVLEDAGLSNGMGFSPDLSLFYHTDTQRRTITRFDYNRATGEITNPAVIVHETDGSRGFPDGMAVDADGNLWSARWDGYMLVQHDPDGNVLREVKFPAKKVSSVTFGGDDLTDMYVTTAGGHDKAENGETAGALYHLNLGVKGMAEFRSRIVVK
jgi:D-xylono/L-arabinono-1,4-lactonase